MAELISFLVGGGGVFVALQDILVNLGLINAYERIVSNVSRYPTFFRTSHAILDNESGCLKCWMRSVVGCKPYVLQHSLLALALLQSLGWARYVAGQGPGELSQISSVGC